MTTGIVTLVLVAAILTGVDQARALLYRRRYRQLAAAVPAGLWGAPCVEQSAPRRWRTLVVGDDGPYLLGQDGIRVRSWAWAEIDVVTVIPFRVGFNLRDGVVLHLRDGSDFGLFIPAEKAKRYPARSADRAAAELRGRLPARSRQVSASTRSSVA